MTISSTSKTPAKPGSRSLLLLGVLALAALAILLSLGNWQLNRLAEKEKLIAHVEAAIHEPASPAPGPGDWPAAGEKLDPLEIDYRHVKLSGHFLEGTAFYFTSITEKAGRHGGPGYLVYSPFETTEGWRVLINRGFIPQSMLNDASTLFSVSTNTAGELQTLVGLLRLSEKPNWTTPSADSAKMVWFARDTEAMAVAMGQELTGLAPYSIDLDAAYSGTEGLPQAGETIVRFKNDHLGYALTWFGLAATLVGVFATYCLSVLRRGPEAPTEI